MPSYKYNMRIISTFSWSCSESGHLFIYLQGHLNSLFCELLFISFAHFSIGQFVFFLFIWEKNLNMYIYLYNSLLLYVGQIFSPCLPLALDLIIRNFLLVFLYYSGFLQLSLPVTAHRCFLGPHAVFSGNPLPSLNHVLKANVGWVESVILR